MLGTLISVLALHMLINLITQHLLSGALTTLGISFGFCYGPIFYLYSRSLAYQTFRFSYQQFIHLLPAVIAQVLVLTTHIPVLVYAVSIFISLLIYSGMIWKLLREYRYILSQTRSEYDQITLNWLSYMLVLQIGLLALNITSVSLASSGMILAGAIAELLLFIGLWLMVSFIIFQGLQHPRMFSGLTIEDKQIVSEEAGTNTLSDTELDNIISRVETHMKNAQPFLNSGLTVKSLGRQLAIIPRHVSQAINLKTNKNFSEYVNSFRVKLACELLSSPESQELSVMDVMLECGFITKSNFNRAFKAETGTTPFNFKRGVQEAAKN